MLAWIYIFAVVGYLSLGVGWVVFTGRSAKDWFTPAIIAPTGDRILDVCGALFAEPVDAFVSLALLVCLVAMYAALWPIIIPLEVFRLQYIRRKRFNQAKSA